MNNSLRGLEKYVVILRGQRLQSMKAHGSVVAAITGTSTQRKGVV